MSSDRPTRRTTAPCLAAAAATARWPVCCESSQEILFGTALAAAFLAKLKRIQVGALAASEQMRRTIIEVQREVRHD